MGWEMKPGLRLISTAVALWPFLAWGLTCKENEYPLKNVKCCKYCPPGQQLAKRCTATSETHCEPCEENYYSDSYTYSRCKRCTECNSERGLQEVRPCQRTSNIVCACLPGHAPEENKEHKGCKPCPSGTFSRGGSEKCRPWTNCTASGRQILYPGKEDMDTICDNPSSEIPTQPTVTQPTPFKNRGGALTVTPEPFQIISVRHPGFVWILVTVVLLLTTAGVLVLLFFYRRMKKEKLEMLRSGIFAVPCEDEGCNYRMPVQEQEIGDKSNFVQD